MKRIKSIDFHALGVSPEKRLFMEFKSLKEKGRSYYVAALKESEDGVRIDYMVYYPEGVYDDGYNCTFEFSPEALDNILAKLLESKKTLTELMELGWRLA